MTALSTRLTATDSADERRLVGWVLVVMLLFFWPTLVEFPGTWSAAGQEHGFFVAALTLWLIWRDRDLTLRLADGGIPDLLPVLVGLSAVWMLAAIMSVRLVQQFLLAVICVTWAFAVFGWRARSSIVPIGVTFLLAVPFWSLLVPFLQRATTVASGGATQLAGISAVIGYDYIQISSGTFLVESGCAGLNYLMGGLVLGAFYAHLFVDRWQTQLKIVALAGVMSIVGNWVRVSVLIFLGEATAMQSPYIEDHLWQGWAIFTALMIPTYALALRIERVDAVRYASTADADRTELAPQPTDHASDEGGAPVAVEPSLGGETPAVDSFDPSRPRRASLAALAAISGPIVFMSVGAIPRGTDIDQSVEVLGVAESWDVSEGATHDEWRPDFFGVDAEAAWTLSNGTAQVGATRQYFMDQKQGDELIHNSNMVAPDSMVVSDQVVGPVGPERRLVREALFRTPEGARVAWYWYRVAGQDTPFETKAKLLEVLGFFIRSPASELVTLSAACGPEDCRAAAQALRSAMGAPPLPPPEEDPGGGGPSAPSGGD